MNDFDTENLLLCKRLLTTIEHLIVLEDPMDENKLAGRCYKIAHLGSGCKNKHLTWMKEFKKIEEEVK